MPGYTLSQYNDLPGFDISCSLVGVRTVNDLRIGCSLTPGCKVFNLFVRDGLVQSCSKKLPAPTTRVLSLLVSQQSTLMAQRCMGVYISNTGKCVGCIHYCQRMAWG